MAKNDVTKGLDPDLFDKALGDDEADSEGAASAPEEAAAPEESTEKEPAEKEQPEAATPPEEDPPKEEEQVEGATESTEKDPEEASTEEAPAEEAPKEAKAPKRPRGRPKKKKTDAADPPDIEAIASSYEVQRGFTATDGKTYHPGDVIPIQCRHCALWEREWLGKTRCSAGRRLDEDTVMHPERFSCGAFFICKEFDPELSTFLSMPLAEIMTVRSMLPGIKKILQASSFLSKWVERHTFDGDIKTSFTNAKGFVLTFNSEEQLRLAEGFIRQYATVASKRAREKRPPRPKYNGGDWVEWKDSKTGETIEGIILSKTRGNIWLAGTKVHKGQKFTYKYKEWKANYSPKVTRRSAEAE
jgi:hypothetical protein